jgi:hypothetical protein
MRFRGNNKENLRLLGRQKFVFWGKTYYLFRLHLPNGLLNFEHVGTGASCSLGDCVFLIEEATFRKWFCS